MAWLGIRRCLLLVAALLLGSCKSDCADPCPPAERCLVITEFAAAGTTLLDEDGEVHDWIEIHNRLDRAVRIEDYYLTDDPAQTRRWQIPSCDIEARGYLVVYASRKNRRGSELHTDFVLRASGEYLALVRPDGTTVVSQYSPEYPRQFEGISHGLEFVDGRPTDQPKYFPEPTPGAPNGPGTDAFGQFVEFSPPAGTFTNTVSVTLEPSEDVGMIHYTLDGSSPDATSPMADAPIELTRATTIRARVFADGFGGPIGSSSYIALSPEVASFNSDLPVGVIRVEQIVDEDHSIWTDGVMTTVEPGVDGRASLMDAPTHTGAIGLRRRGNTTSYFPKVQYSLETRDATHEDQDVELFGLPEESDWVLNAPYSDKSLLRIHFSMGLARRMGEERWAPRTKLVELFIAEADEVVTLDHYVGVYVVLEKIKRDDERVDIARLLPSDDTDELITGGYIVVIDRVDPGDRGFRTNGGVPMAFVEPNEAEITGRQSDYIVGFLNDLERRIDRDDFGNYEEVLDVDSFIDQHLLIELTRNVDGLRLSTYMYKDRDGRLVMGPPWDYNLSLGNSQILAGWTTEGWQHAQLDATPPATEMCNCPVTTSRDCEVGCAPMWMKRLFQDPSFQARYRARWAELRSGVFSDAAVLGDLDQAVMDVAEAQARNFERWRILGEFLFGNTFVFDTWEEEVMFLRDFLVARLAWMDSQLL